jgi:hypothetical protein
MVLTWLQNRLRQRYAQASAWHPASSIQQHAEAAMCQHILYGLVCALAAVLNCSGTVSLLSAGVFATMERSFKLLHCTRIVCNGVPRQHHVIATGSNNRLSYAATAETLSAKAVIFPCHNAKSRAAMPPVLLC